jgi:hypothetical protein
VVVFFDGMFAVALDVPELDLAVWSGGEDVSAVGGDGAGEDLLGVAVLREALGGLSGSEVPETESFVPWWWEEIVVVVGEGEVTNEVGVSSERLDGDSEVWDNFGFIVEIPDKDGPISGGDDEDLSILVFLLRVSSLDYSLSSMYILVSHY